MVNFNRVKTVSTGTLTTNAGGAIAYVGSPVNGKLESIQVDMGTAAAADVVVYNANFSGNSTFNYLAVAASGDRVYYPRALPVNMSGAAITNAHSQHVLANKWGVDVTTGGESKTLSVTLHYV